jgi:general secretion pathway protein J
MKVLAAVHKQRGFTLLEVLLAMVVTAFVAVLAYSALSTAIAAAEVQEANAKRMTEIQQLVSLIERDLRHSVERSVVDAYGDRQAAFSGGRLDDFWLRLTRRGWDNPTEQRRAQLQRVRYVLDGEQLWREYWPVLDRSDEQAGMQRLLLLDGISQADIEFLNPADQGAEQSELGGVWQSRWSEQQTGLPLAVEFSLTINGFGELRRVVALTPNR